jgi:hypothetical protein
MNSICYDKEQSNFINTEISLWDSQKQKISVTVEEKLIFFLTNISHQAHYDLVFHPTQYNYQTK